MRRLEVEFDDEVYDRLVAAVRRSYEADVQASAAARLAGTWSGRSPSLDVDSQSKALVAFLVEEGLNRRDQVHG